MLATIRTYWRRQSRSYFSDQQLPTDVADLGKGRHEVQVGECEYYCYLVLSSALFTATVDAVPDTQHWAILLFIYRQKSLSRPSKPPVQPDCINNPQSKIDTTRTIDPHRSVTTNAVIFFAISVLPWTSSHIDRSTPHPQSG